MRRKIRIRNKVKRRIKDRKANQQAKSDIPNEELGYRKMKQVSRDWKPGIDKFRKELGKRRKCMKRQ